MDESSSPSDCSWGYQNSFTDNEDSQDLEKCLLSQIVEQDKPTIFLFGDSHSTSLASSVKKTSLNSNYNFAQASHVYCPFRKNYSMNWKVSSPVLPFSCSNFNKSLDNFLQKYARKNDVVILASRDSYYFSDEMPISIEHKKDFANGFTKYYDKKDKMISRKTMARLAFNDVKSLSEMLSLKKLSNLGLTRS